MDPNAKTLCAHGRGCAECFAYLTDRINSLERQLQRGSAPVGHHPACFAAQNDKATCGCGAVTGPDGLKVRLNDLVSLCCSVGGKVNKLIPWRGSVSDFFTDINFVLTDQDLEALGDKIRLRNWGR